MTLSLDDSLSLWKIFLIKVCGNKVWRERVRIIYRFIDDSISLSLEIFFHDCENLQWELSSITSSSLSGKSFSRWHLFYLWVRHKRDRLLLTDYYYYEWIITHTHTQKRKSRKNIGTTSKIYEKTDDQTTVTPVILGNATAEPSFW